MWKRSTGSSAKNPHRLRKFPDAGYLCLDVAVRAKVDGLRAHNSKASGDGRSGVEFNAEAQRTRRNAETLRPSASLCLISVVFMSGWKIRGEMEPCEKPFRKLRGSVGKPLEEHPHRLRPPSAPSGARDDFSRAGANAVKFAVLISSAAAGFWRRFAGTPFAIGWRWARRDPHRQAGLDRKWARRDRWPLPG